MKSIAKKLLDEYNGNMRNIEQESSSTKELEEKLEEFKGVGPVTATIFLRELRGIWDNADPELSDIETMAAKDCGIVSNEQDATQQVKQFWDDNAIEGFDFRNFQAALVRHGFDIRRSE